MQPAAIRGHHAAGKDGSSALKGGGAPVSVDQHLADVFPPPGLNSRTVTHRWFRCVRLGCKGSINPFWVSEFLVSAACCTAFHCAISFGAGNGSNRFGSGICHKNACAFSEVVLGICKKALSLLLRDELATEDKEDGGDGSMISLFHFHGESPGDLCSVTVYGHA